MHGEQVILRRLKLVTEAAFSAVKYDQLNGTVPIFLFLSATSFLLSILPLCFCLFFFPSFCIIFFVLIYLCLLVSVHHFSSHYFNLSVFVSVLSVFFILPVSLYLPFPSFSSLSYTFHSPWNVSQELSRNISPFFCHFISNYHFSFLDGDKRNLFDNFFFSKLCYLADWSDSLLICQIFFQFFVSCE